jgi:hypothetical protein
MSREFAYSLSAAGAVGIYGERSAPFANHFQKGGLAI